MLAKLPSSSSSRVPGVLRAAHATRRARRTRNGGSPASWNPDEAWYCLQAERLRRENHATIPHDSALGQSDRFAFLRVGFGADAAHLVGAQQSATQRVLEAAGGGVEQGALQHPHSLRVLRDDAVLQEAYGRALHQVGSRHVHGHRHAPSDPIGWATRISRT